MNLMLAVLLFALPQVVTAAQTPASHVFDQVDEAPVTITRPATHLCNLTPEPDANGFIPAVCITGPEHVETCADQSRVLLHSEDGTGHCIDFKKIVPNIVYMASPATTQSDSAVGWQDNGKCLLPSGFTITDDSEWDCKVEIKLPANQPKGNQ